MCACAPPHPAHDDIGGVPEWRRALQPSIAAGSLKCATATIDPIATGTADVTYAELDMNLEGDRRQWGLVGLRADAGKSWRSNL